MTFPWDRPGGLIQWYAERYGVTSEQAALLLRHPPWRRYFEACLRAAGIAA